MAEAKQLLEQQAKDGKEVLDKLNKVHGPVVAFAKDKHWPALKIPNPKCLENLIDQDTGDLAQ